MGLPRPECGGGARMMFRSNARIISFRECVYSNFLKIFNSYHFVLFTI